jgi:hypothetical protein
MVNKKTWFSHWFRGGGGPGFPYHMNGNEIKRVRKYSEDLWLNNKWPQQVRTFQWLVEKFKPPTWDLSAIIPEPPKERKVITIDGKRYKVKMKPRRPK